MRLGTETVLCIQVHTTDFHVSGGNGGWSVCSVGVVMMEVLFEFVVRVVILLVLYKK